MATDIDEKLTTLETQQELHAAGRFVLTLQLADGSYECASGPHNGLSVHELLNHERCGRVESASAPTLDAAVSGAKELADLTF